MGGFFKCSFKAACFRKGLSKVPLRNFLQIVPSVERAHVADGGNDVFRVEMRGRNPSLGSVQLAGCRQGPGEPALLPPAAWSIGPGPVVHPVRSAREVPVLIRILICKDLLLFF